MLAFGVPVEGLRFAVSYRVCEVPGTLRSPAL